MSILFIFLFFLLFILLSILVLLFQLLSWELPNPRLLYNTFGRDVRAGLRYLKVLIFIRRCHARNATIGELFQDVVKKHPNKPCFLFEDQTWTFQQVEDYSNQVANVFEAAGYQKGDEIALFMENRPEYVCIWLGLSKIGVICAFINTNLRVQSLAHSINVVDCKAIIFNANLVTAVKDVVPFLTRKSSIDYFCLDTIKSDTNSIYVKSLDYLLQDASKIPPSKSKHRIGFNDKLIYIYTSGTTGLPKAAIIKHSRFIWFLAGTRFVIGLNENDVAYNCLPMYHSAGGLLFLGVVLAFGVTMAIRKKFSASNFWTDAIKYKVTATQYIGEICRYLLNQPKRPEETQHTIRLICGNGLRPQIWKEFQERFRIPHIVEIYGATEGNANVVNIFGKVGAVGFVSRLFSRLYPVTLIRVDPETGEPLRNEKGLCIRCEPGEPGEIVGKILLNNPVNSFDGYVNKTATQKKMIRNCFQKGDAAFLSGDILIMDEDGYLYFMDRTGDTFRWRGENVSTGEVESIISKVLGLVTCVVYGVEIPGVEGKAGMVAIQSDTKIDVDTFYKEISTSLPSFAVPLFIRICKNIETTGTYKLRKVELQKEGFDPTNISDPIFMLDAKARSYVRLDENGYKKILNKEIKL